MFGDIAIQLLKYMGHSGSSPSALMAKDIPQALQKLESALETEGQSPTPQQSENNDDNEPPIKLSQRAMPLIELLKAADKAKDNVMWE